MADRQVHSATGAINLTRRAKVQGNSDYKINTDTVIMGTSLLTRDPEVPPPVDFENFLDTHHGRIEGDTHKELLTFPKGDVEVRSSKLFQRTLECRIPAAARSSTVPHVRRCIDSLLAEWHVCERKCVVDSTSRLQKLRQLQSDMEKNNMYPRQEYEVDAQAEPKQEEVPPSTPRDRSPSLKRSTLSAGDSFPAPIRTPEPRRLTGASDFAAQSSSGLAELEEMEEDDVLADVLDDTIEDEELDRLNQERRNETRVSKIMQLYPHLEFEETRIEDRNRAAPLAEQIGYRLLVKCLDLTLELDVEPIYAIMALYDVREKKKISEDFHFDLNSSAITKMMDNHSKEQCIPSLSRSAIFSISYPNPDIFLVVKLEKVYQQKEISESAEPYMKENDTAKNRERVRVQAQLACEKLGKYRMPFAWTAISVQEMVNSGVQSSYDRRDTGKSEELRVAQRAVFEKMQESQANGLVFAPGRTGIPPDQPDQLTVALTSFKPVTLTVNSFFRQEGDKLENESLFRLLAELKKQGSLIRRLKCIPGSLKLDISVPGSKPPCCLTPDLYQVEPYPDPHCRPTREVEEHPPRPVLYPFSTYKNILYVSPTHLNFTNRGGSARNIAIRVSLHVTENDTDPPLKVIYGKSSCAKFLSEAWTAVTYHNRTPDFYEEVKIQLPVAVTHAHHLLFTIYHIKSKEKDSGADPMIIGYTWLPLLHDLCLLNGDFFLPVLVDKPQPGFSRVTPEAYGSDGQGTGLKWVDNKKPLFKVSLKAISSLYAQDRGLAGFLEGDFRAPTSAMSPCDARERTHSPVIPNIDRRGSKVSQTGTDYKFPYDFSNMSPEEMLSTRIESITKFCSPDVLIQHLPLTINRCLTFLTSSDIGRVTTAAMAGLVKVVHLVHDQLNEACDGHGRCGLLNSYVAYHFNALAFGGNSEPDESLMTITENTSFDDRTYPNVHEALVNSWLELENKCLEEAMTHSWFFFDLITKSMTQHLHQRDLLSAGRLDRFETSFVEKIAKLVIVVSAEVVVRHIKNPKFSQHLNASLAFFLQGLLSLMDRGAVFSMVRAYLRQVTMAAAADVTLSQLKLDLVRVLCSHEHYLQLNLVLSPWTLVQILRGGSLNGSPKDDRLSVRERATSTLTEGSSERDRTPVGSPTPGWKIGSRCSLVDIINRLNFSDDPSPHILEDDPSDGDSMTLTEDNVYSDLTTDYRQTHFISGLLLSEIAMTLEGNIPKLQRQAIATLRDLMVWHDLEYTAPTSSYIALLYIPLLGIVMDNFTRLWRDFSVVSQSTNSETPNSESKEFDLGDDAEVVANFFQNSSGGVSGYKTAKVSTSITATGNRPFNQEVTRDLLMCFMWVIKNLSSQQFLRWWSCLELVRRTMFLAVLDVSVAAFEYRGRRQSGASQGASDVKSRLANAILSGTGTAREKLIERRRQQQQANKGGCGQKERRWGTTYHQLNIEGNIRSSHDADLDNELESQLACETTLTVLDAVELIVSDASLDEEDMLNTMLSYAMRVMVHLLSTNQSVISLANIFASQRALVSKFPEFLVEVDTEQGSELCSVLIHLCNSSISQIRSEAAASLYLIMRANYDLSQGFARIKAQSTVGLSNLAAKGMNCNPNNVRKALRTILAYADADDDMLNSSFPDQVRELIGNMHMILRDTINLTECNKDPVLLLDLMYRIATGYQNSPDLRLSWLQNMAQKHAELENQTEAAMCMVHAAALVAEYLSMLGEDQFCPSGCADFEKVTPNSLEESAISDDALAPEDQSIISSKLFSVGGLVGLLNRASALFDAGGAWEYCCMLDQLTIPIFETMGDHRLLVKTFQRMADLQQKIIDQGMKNRRVVSTYFLVKFFGDLFEDLDGQEFIYRERPHYKLSELTQRFENFYDRSFGAQNLVVLKDSKEPDRSKFDPDKGYMQLAYVTPYFAPYELKRRQTFFKKTNNLCRFCYDIPFTETGKAHGEIDSQCKRRTVITTSNTFPYVKTRCEVVMTEEIVLSPAEVALEDMMDKYESLIEAARRDPPDPKGLQLQLQGVVGTRVNSGPSKVATVFFKVEERDGKPVSTLTAIDRQDPVLRKLKRCFKDLLTGAQEALEKNRELISDNQREYQKELERNFVDFKFELEPILGKKAMSRFSRQKTCRKL